MGYFTKILGILSLATLFLFPIVATSKRWGISQERDVKLIEQAEQCGPERRDRAGRCIVTTRTVGRRRSFFDGGSGRGK